MDIVMPGDRLGPAEALNFLDIQSITLPAPLAPLEAWARIMAQPLPGLAAAFAIRDAISARFGVQRIGGFSGRAVGTPKVGDRLDFFVIEGLSEHHLTLTARDSHLDVLINLVSVAQVLTLTASVITHNWFGRVYMLPVGPVHRVIVRAMLRRLQTSLAAQAPADAK